MGLVELVNALSTDEGKAHFVYSHIKRLNHDDAVNAIAELKPALSAACLRRVTACAFADTYFSLGFLAASAGGFIEELVSEIMACPYEFAPGDYCSLPGSPKLKRMFSVDEAHYHRGWLRGVNESLVADFLVPQRRFKEAVELCIKVSPKGNAVAGSGAGYAHLLSLEELMALCLKHHALFEVAVEKARGTAYEEELKNAHIDSLVSNTNFEWFGRQERWTRAADLAGKYGLGRVAEIVEKGIESLIRDFENFIRTECYSLRCRNSGWGDEEKEEREKIQLARRMRVKTPLPEVQVLVKLIEFVDGERKRSIRADVVGRLHKACDGSYSSSVYDSLGVAVAFGQNKTAFDLAVEMLFKAKHASMYAAYPPGCLGADELISIISWFPPVSIEERKKYISALVECERFSEAYETARIAAGCVDYLVGLCVDGKEFYQGAEIALKEGLRTKAKELFIRGAFFDRASELAESDEERACLAFRDTRKNISFNRHRFAIDCKAVKECIVLARDYKNSEMSGLAVEFAQSLLGNSNYVAACLFAEGAGVDLAALVRPEHIEYAEKKGDFVSCMYLCRAKGDSARADAYNALIGEERRMLTSIEFGLGVRQSPAVKDSVKLSAGDFESVDDSVPF